MPLRSPFSIISFRSRQLFHSYRPQCQIASHEPTHYETLQIPANATPSEVKKAFYSLSKTHHPDRNPSDPTAPARFIALSTAYNTLSIPATRASYDLSLLSAQAQSIPHGSYSSTNPAGGRSPSGLSTRRAHFRGPPPSFYHNGGWGAHESKRRSAHEETISSSHNHTSGPSANHVNSAAGSAAGGMGPGQSPFGYGLHNDVPHFDREGHFRTQEKHRLRFEHRARQSGIGRIEKSDSTAGVFLVVIAILVIGAWVPVKFIIAEPDQMRDTGKKKS